jgi:hypothetical protein
MARVLAAAFAALFGFAALLQYNDPDALAWIALYLAACMSCLLTVFRRTEWELSAATGLVALIWALTLLPRAAHVPIAELFAAWEMADAHIEVAREMYGLLVVFAVCAPLARQQWSAARAAELKARAGS